MEEAWNHAKYHSMWCSSSCSLVCTVSSILVFAILKQQVGGKMEEFSILAYSTLPLEWGGGEGWMLGSDHRGLTNILYKIQNTP
jgi:hypothetical protein